MADICLVTHVTAAVNQQIDLAPYPTVKRIFETAMALPEFARAHPSMQPDTPEAMRPKKGRPLRVLVRRVASRSEDG